MVSIQQLRGHNFSIFYPSPLRGQFYNLTKYAPAEPKQKQTFFTLPPHLVQILSY